LVDGESKGVVSSYTFTNVTADHTISASFAINTYIGKDCYGVSSSSDYDVGTGKTTFTYTVWEKWHGEGLTCTCPEIEKIKLEFGDVSWEANVSMTVDAHTGNDYYEKEVKDGEIKIHKLEPEFIQGTITITFTGYVEEGVGTLNIKAHGGGNDWDFDVDKPNI